VFVTICVVLVGAVLPCAGKKVEIQAVTNCSETVCSVLIIIIIIIVIIICILSSCADSVSSC
jgi:hypothetical protein